MKPVDRHNLISRPQFVLGFGWRYGRRYSLLGKEENQNESKSRGTKT